MIDYDKRFAIIRQIRELRCMLLIDDIGSIRAMEPEGRMRDSQIALKEHNMREVTIEMYVQQIDCVRASDKPIEEKESEIRRLKGELHQLTIAHSPRQIVGTANWGA